MVKLPFAWTFINDGNSTLGKAYYEIKCGSVRCMLHVRQKEQKSTSKLCHHISKVGFPLFVVDCNVSITKGGVENASGGIGSGDGGVQVKVGNELVGDKELDKEVKRL